MSLPPTSVLYEFTLPGGKHFLCNVEHIVGLAEIDAKANMTRVLLAPNPMMPYFDVMGSYSTVSRALQAATNRPGDRPGV